MSDQTLNRYLASGPTSARTAFVPNPGTPASGPSPGYTWFDTTLNQLFAWSGSAWVSTAGSGGITQLTGDVTAGPGSGSQAATLAASGVTAGTYGDGTHIPVVTVDATGRATALSTVATAAAGITQLTGDGTAGPGSGSQALTLAASGVSAATYGDATHVPQIAVDGKGRVTAAANVAISGGGGGGGGLVLLEEHTAASSASLAFTTRNVTGQSGHTFQSDYDVYQIEIINIALSTDLAQLQCQVSSDGGSTWVASGNYYSAFGGVTNGGATFVSALGNPASAWILMGDLANNWTVNGSLHLYTPLSTTTYKQMTGNLIYADHVNMYAGNNLSALTISGTGYNAVQFAASTGNIASGTVRCYGLAK